MVERLLTIEEKGNEIIEMCKEHGIFMITFNSKNSGTGLPEYVDKHSRINVDMV